MQMVLVIKGFTCGKQLKLPVLFHFFSLDNIKQIHDLKNIVIKLKFDIQFLCLLLFFKTNCNCIS